MAETAIEWATHVWNPVTGCDRVSPGCANCYALTYAGRLKAMGQPKYQRDGGKASGPGFGVTMHDDELEAPARWRKPRRVFVNSMSDLFHEEVTDEFIARVFAVMAEAYQHDFLVLTKRPDRMRDLLNDVGFIGMASTRVGPAALAPLPWPLGNVWLGVSVENGRFRWRADVLRETPAAVRFVSAEPLLGPLMDRMSCGSCWDWPDTDCDECEGLQWWWSMESLDLTDIDWLIVGGESGQHLGESPHRFLVDQQGRPRDDRAHWVRDLRDACAAGDTAFFFKQWGGRTPKAGGRELDGRTWDELPAAARATEVIA